MYMHMCTYTHTHTALIRSVTRGWILQGFRRDLFLTSHLLFSHGWVSAQGQTRQGSPGGEAAGAARSQGKQRRASWRPAGGSGRHFAGGTASTPPAPPPTRPRPVSVVTPIRFLHKSNEKLEIPARKRAALPRVPSSAGERGGTRWQQE